MVNICDKEINAIGNTVKTRETIKEIVLQSSIYFTFCMYCMHKKIDLMLRILVKTIVTAILISSFYIIHWHFNLNINHYYTLILISFDLECQKYG
jgi:hypothetical protein